MLIKVPIDPATEPPHKTDGISCLTSRLLNICAEKIYEKISIIYNTPETSHTDG